MSTITLSWDVEGVPEAYTIYRSISTIDIQNLPTPLVEGLADKTYTDSDIVDGVKYYYRISSIKGMTSKISDEIVIIADTQDVYYLFVELLVFADAETYPSRNFIDSSKYNKTITLSNPTTGISIVDQGTTASKYDNGSIYCGSSSYIYSTITPLGLDDFTFEFHMKGTPLSNFLTFPYSPNVLGSGGYNAIYFEISGQQIGVALNVSGGGLYLIEPNSISAINQTIWKHICLMRANKILYLFVDGILVGSSSSEYNFNTSYLKFLGGSNYYLNSIRLTRVARYNTSGFTPQTSKYRPY